MMAGFKAQPVDDRLSTAMLRDSLNDAGGTAGEGVLARGGGWAPDPLNRAKALDVIERLTTRWAS